VELPLKRRAAIRLVFATGPYELPNSAYMCVFVCVLLVCVVCVCI